MGLENPLHILLILVVVLMLFGAKRLPEMGRGLGDGMRGFRDALSGHTQTDHAAAMASAPAPAAALPTAPSATEHAFPSAATDPVAVPVGANQD